MAGVSAGRWFVTRSVIVVAMTAMVVSVSGFGSMAVTVTVAMPTVTMSRAGPGIDKVVMGVVVPMRPMGMGMHRLPLKVEMEDGGIAQGIPLIPGVVGNEDLMAYRNVARFGDQKVKNTAGNAPVIGHVLVHCDGDGLAGSGPQILIGTIQSDRGAYWLGVDLESAEDVLGAEQSGHQG